MTIRGQRVIGMLGGMSWESSKPVQAAVGIPLVHLGDATAATVKQTGLRRVGLLGTAFTMDQDFYRGRLAEHGLDVIVPPPEDRAEVHRIIYDELCLGEVREQSRQVYRGVIERLVDAGVEGIILGCTEIELLISAADSPVPVFAPTRLHVEAAVAASLALLNTMPLKGIVRFGRSRHDVARQ